jgi:hypothetical protein
MKIFPAFYFESFFFMNCGSLSVVLLITSQYGGYTLCNRGGSQQDFHVCLHLGLTDYRYGLQPQFINTIY